MEMLGCTKNMTHASLNKILYGVCFATLLLAMSVLQGCDEAPQTYNSAVQVHHVLIAIFWLGIPVIIYMILRGCCCQETCIKCENSEECIRLRQKLPSWTAFYLCVAFWIVFVGSVVGMCVLTWIYLPKYCVEWQKNTSLLSFTATFG